MITESFLNSCFTLLLNKNSKVKKTKALSRDILDILNFSESKETLDVPLVVKSKLECLRKIISLLLDGKTIDNVIDSISLTEKFKQYIDFLDVKINEMLKDEVFQDIIRQVRLRKKINALFTNYDELSMVLDSIKDGSFESIDDLVDNYEVTIKKLYKNMVDSNRNVALEAAASLDLVKDDYDMVINMIKKKYERVNKTPTGFDILDNSIMLGGFEPSRLYIWGGGSGAGKSTMLNNTIIKSALKDLTVDAKPFKTGEINKVYVYITLENTIEEALMRTYMPMFHKTSKEMLQDIGNNVDIKNSIMTKLAKNGSTIIMKYFPSMSISVIDIMGVVDDAISEYGKDSIAGLYIDYLDLLKTDTRYDMYRLELGHITLSLKTLAVQYNIPVITGSQLGRSAYKIKESKDLNVDQMSESIKKVEHADFVGLLAKDQFDDTIVHGKIGKNRSGKANVAIDFKVDFARYEFTSASKKVNVQKADSTTDQCKFKFEGLTV